MFIYITFPYIARLYETMEALPPLTDMQTLEWDTLEIWRCKSVATMGYKVVNRLVAIPPTQLTPAKDSIRSNGMAFIQISTSTNYYKYSFFPALVKIWNSLPADLVSAKDLDRLPKKICPPSA